MTFGTWAIDPARPVLATAVHAAHELREEVPGINLGTGSLPPRWKPVAQTLLDTKNAMTVGGGALDAREHHHQTRVGGARPMQVRTSPPPTPTSMGGIAA